MDVARPVRRSGSGAARAADGDGGGGQRKDWWADYASRPLEFGLSPAAVPHVEYQFATADRDLPTKWLAVVAGTRANIVRMYQEPYGPTLVVGQLQFEFENIEPLTLDQRLRIWLDSQDNITSDVLTATLFVTDNESRRRRSDRWMELLCLQAPYQHQTIMASGGIEVVWLYKEACRSYVNGAFLSALMCSHAACERMLAGCLFAYREELGNGWLMWGLGRACSSGI